MVSALEKFQHGTGAKLSTVLAVLGFATTVIMLLSLDSHSPTLHSYVTHIDDAELTIVTSISLWDLQLSNAYTSLGWFRRSAMCAYIQNA